MKKVKYNDTYIYIDDTPVDIKETGVVITEDDELENTMEIEKITNDDILEDTITDIYGVSNE